MARQPVTDAVLRDIGRLGVQMDQENPHFRHHMLGRMDRECSFGRAKFWAEERTGGSLAAPKYSKCCSNGTVDLLTLQPPPEPLQTLLTATTPDAKHFQAHSRAYNSAFQFASTGVNYETTVPGGGVQNLRMHGRMYHRIGSLYPAPERQAKFAQIYILDTDYQVQCRHLFLCLQCAPVRPCNAGVTPDMIFCFAGSTSQ